MIIVLNKNLQTTIFKAFEIETQSILQYKNFDILIAAGVSVSASKSILQILLHKIWFLQVSEIQPIVKIFKLDKVMHWREKSLPQSRLLLFSLKNSARCDEPTTIFTHDDIAVWKAGFESNVHGGSWEQQQHGYRMFGWQVTGYFLLNKLRSKVPLPSAIIKNNVYS